MCLQITMSLVGCPINHWGVIIIAQSQVSPTLSSVGLLIGLVALHGDEVEVAGVSVKSIIGVIPKVAQKGGHP